MEGVRKRGGQETLLPRGGSGAAGSGEARRGVALIQDAVSGRMGTVVAGVILVLLLVFFAASSSSSSAEDGAPIVGEGMNEPRVDKSGKPILNKAVVGGRTKKQRKNGWKDGGLSSLNLMEELKDCPLTNDTKDLNKNDIVRVITHRSDRRLKMAVYGKDRFNPSVDVVSDQLAGNGEFEPRLVNTMRAGFEEMAKNTSMFNQSDFLFVDIGSNVGVYSMVMSNLGVNTFSIDALRNNVALLDYSERCLNPYLVKLNVEENVTFRVVQSALASPQQMKAAGPKGECALVSEFDNLGDAMMICDEAKIEELVAKKYNIRDRMKLQTLDTVFERYDIKTKIGTLVKMDIEGQEWHAIQGGMKSLFNSELPRQLQPKMVMAEIWPKFFDEAEAHRYASFMMEKMGYWCAIEGTTSLSMVDPDWCDFRKKDENGNRYPCAMKTPKQFVKWLFSNVKITEMKNLFWVQPEWGAKLAVWAWPISFPTSRKGRAAEKALVDKIAQKLPEVLQVTKDPRK